MRQKFRTAGLEYGVKSRHGHMKDSSSIPDQVNETKVRQRRIWASGSGLEGHFASQGVLGRGIQGGAGNFP